MRGRFANRPDLRRGMYDASMETCFNEGAVCKPPGTDLTAGAFTRLASMRGRFANRPDEGTDNVTLYSYSFNEGAVCKPPGPLSWH